MFNLLAEVDVTAQIGQVVGPTATPTVVATASPTPTPTSTSTSSSTTAPTATATATTTPTFKPVFSIPPALIPEKQYRKGSFAIYGYGPINSEVSLNGIGVSAKTTSDSQGFFVFSPIYSYSSIYPELCIQATDNLKRLTQPSCIPAFPVTNKLPSVVGPVLLSPTISLSTNKVTEGDTAITSGRTIPNAEVDIYISKKDRTVSLVKTVHAYSIPTIKTKSDNDGNYEFSLSTIDAANYKIYVANKLGDDQSSKSNSLNFTVATSVKSIFERIIEFFITNKMRVVVLLEALIAIILGLIALKSTTHRHKKHSEKDYLEEMKKLLWGFWITFSGVVYKNNYGNC